MANTQAVDYVTATMRAMWELLNGSTFLTSAIKSGNRVDFLSGKKWPEKQNINAGDLPSLVTGVESTRILNANLAATFANTRGATGDRIIEQEVVFKLSLMYDGFDLNIPNQVRTEICTVLMDNPRLGLDYIKSSGKIASRPRPNPPNSTNSTKGITEDLLFPVIYQLHRALIFPNG